MYAVCRQIIATNRCMYGDNREIIFGRIPTYVITIHQRHRQTDDMRSQDRALHCSASRGKN